MLRNFVLILSFLTNDNFLYFQLYEISDDPKRKEFLDDLFQFMQKRGKSVTFYFRSPLPLPPSTPLPTTPS